MPDPAGAIETLLLFTGILVLGLVALLPSIHLVVTGGLGAGQLVLAALAAMLVSDSLWYLAGRFRPLDRWEGSGPLAASVQRVRRFAHRFRRRPEGSLFASRMLYGTHIPICVACGLVRIPWARFLAVNLVSGLAWLALLFLLTFAVGSTVEHLADGTVALRLALAVLVVLAVALRIVLRGAGRRGLAEGAGAAADAPARSVSVVIPACNEAPWLAAAIRSARRQSVPAEVIVVENGSTDGTAAIALRCADRVVRTPKPAGYSRARNLGARAARGEVLVFLDADSRMAPGALAAILAAARPGTFGTVLGRPDPPRLRYRLFFLLKNLGHRLRLYRGVLGGLFFFDAELFRRSGGFDETLRIDELHELSRRARREGGRYRLVTATWSATSMRRFEKVGLWTSFVFWARLRLGLRGRGRFARQLAAYPEFRRAAPAPGDAAPERAPAGTKPLPIRPELAREP